MEAILNFEVYVCPKCGSLSVGDKLCDYCASDMVSASMTVFDLISNGEVKAYLKTKKHLTEQYCKSSPSFDKPASKNYENESKLRMKDIKRQYLNTVLKRRMQICPKCGHIAPPSLYRDDQTCPLCKTTYVDTNVKGLHYYRRDGSTDADFAKLKNKMRTKFCSKSPEYVPSRWDKRIESEKDIPLRLDEVSLDTGIAMGLIPALISMPSYIKEGRRRLGSLFNKTLGHIAIFCAEIPLSDGETRKLKIEQLKELIDDARNIMVSQEFTGQKKPLKDFQMFLNGLYDQTAKL
jgi:rubrerythrin